RRRNITCTGRGVISRADSSPLIRWRGDVGDVFPLLVGFPCAVLLLHSRNEFHVVLLLIDDTQGPVLPPTVDQSPLGSLGLFSSRPVHRTGDEALELLDVKHRVQLTILLREIKSDIDAVVEDFEYFEGSDPFITQLPPTFSELIRSQHDLISHL